MILNNFKIDGGKRSGSTFRFSAPLLFSSKIQMSVLKKVVLFRAFSTISSCNKGSLFFFIFMRNIVLDFQFFFSWMCLFYLHFSSMEIRRGESIHKKTQNIKNMSLYFTSQKFIFEKSFNYWLQDERNNISWTPKARNLLLWSLLAFLMLFWLPDCKSPNFWNCHNPSPLIWSSKQQAVHESSPEKQPQKKRAEKTHHCIASG